MQASIEQIDGVRIDLFRPEWGTDLGPLEVTVEITEAPDRRTYILSGEETPRTLEELKACQSRDDVRAVVTAAVDDRRAYLTGWSFVPAHPPFVHKKRPDGYCSCDEVVLL